MGWPKEEEEEVVGAAVVPPEEVAVAEVPPEAEALPVVAASAIAGGSRLPVPPAPEAPLEAERLLEAERQRPNPYAHHRVDREQDGLALDEDGRWGDGGRAETSASAGQSKSSTEAGIAAIGVGPVGASLQGYTCNRYFRVSPFRKSPRLQQRPAVLNLWCRE